MTVKRVFIAGVDDILGICFECLHPNCGARHTVAPDKIGSIPSECPRCHQDWIPSKPSGREVPAASPFVNLAEAIASVRALLKTEGFEPNFRVLLEFEEPPR
jgi:hypothetical protein